MPVEATSWTWSCHRCETKSLKHYELREDAVTMFQDHFQEYHLSNVTQEVGGLLE
jgi:hypothetical protein